MVSIDFRTRQAGDEVVLEPSAFLDEHAAALPDEHAVQAGRAARRLGLVPLTLDVEDEQLTLVPGDNRLLIRPGADDALVVRLDRRRRRQWGRIGGGRGGGRCRDRGDRR